MVVDVGLRKPLRELYERRNQHLEAIINQSRGFFGTTMPIRGT